MVSVINKLKKSITNILIEQKSIKEKPLFSTGICRSIKEEEFDIEMLAKSLKPSYKSKKGELL